MSENGNHSNVSVGRRWKCGFVNCANKYMTAETFGFKVNAEGTALKKKQIWTIEQDTNEDVVYIRSHLGRYLASDKYGNVIADEEDIPVQHGFQVEYCPDGKWAFKHKIHSNYLGGTDQALKCFDKSLVAQDQWSIQLDVHPQINLQNIKRTRYAHLNVDNDTLECSEDIPWGADALVTLEFSEGKYSFKTSDHRYLSRDGSLLNELTDDARFTLEIHSGYLAFKDKDMKYLTAVGPGTMKTKNKSVTKDEMFTIEDSHPQVQIVSQNGEGKSVSIKQGTEVSANQTSDLEKIEDTEIFQMMHDCATDTWSFVTHKNKYWTLRGDPPTIMIETSRSKESQFTVEWQQDGSVGIKGVDGKYLANRPTGVMFASNTTFDDSNKYIINIVNRPVLVLKGEHGFVGIKQKQCVCNTHNYDSLQVICKGRGIYNLKGTNGQFLTVDDSNTVVFDQAGGTDFQFQFCGNSQLAIKVKDGNFLQGDQNGQIRAVATELAANSLWEF